MSDEFPELSTLTELTVMLRAAVEPDLKALSGMLLEDRLITPDQESQLLNTLETESTRAANLVCWIRKRVFVDRNYYYKFIDVLRKKEQFNNSVLVQLKKKLEDHQASFQQRFQTADSEQTSMLYMPKLIQPSGKLSGIAYEQKMRLIQEYQYNAQYSLLSSYTKSLMESPNVDIQILGMLTQTTGYTFNGEVNEGIKLANQALKLCDSSSCLNGKILRTRAFYVMSALYRNYQRDKEAREYLDYAVQEVCGIAPGFDSAIVAYQQACTCIKEGKVEKAKECFIRAIDDSDLLSDTYLKIERRGAIIGLALANLGCSKSTYSLDVPISTSDMKNASNLLMDAETEHCSIPKRNRAKLNRAKAILCYKQNKIFEAVQHAESAVNICREYELRGDLQLTSEELLEDLTQKHKDLVNSSNWKLHKRYYILTHPCHKLLLAILIAGSCGYFLCNCIHVVQSNNF